MAQNEITVGVAPDEMFAVLLDPYAYPKWVVGTRRIREVDRDWPRPATRFTTVLDSARSELAIQRRSWRHNRRSGWISKCASARSAWLAFRYGSQTPTPAGAESCSVKSQSPDP